MLARHARSRGYLFIIAVLPDVVSGNRNNVRTFGFREGGRGRVDFSSMRVMNLIRVVAGCWTQAIS